MFLFFNDLFVFLCFSVFYDFVFVLQTNKQKNHTKQKNKTDKTDKQTNKQQQQQTH